MSTLDLAILVLTGSGAALGFVAGVLRQVVRLATCAAAIYAALFYHPQAVPWLQQQFRQTPPESLRLLALGLTFAGTYVALALVTAMIFGMVKAVRKRLGILDRLIGAAVGIAVQGLVGAAIFMGLVLYPPDDRVKAAVDQSHTAQLMVNGLRAVLVACPQEVKDRVDRWLQELRDAAQRQVPAPPPQPLAWSRFPPHRTAILGGQPGRQHA